MHPALDAVGEGPLDRPGRHAVEVGQDLDGRDLERRQDVDGDRDDRDRAEDHEEESENNDAVDVAQGEFDESHRGPLSSEMNE